MLLTQCPVCAAALPARTAKQCSRCKTRYCGPACQKQHWEQGGHDTLCKKIKRGGGAEQYHADKKFTEAVTVAAEACAEDTKGQTCYICMDVVHRSTGEGLVRGCACGDRDGVASGSTGVAHVSCLVDQAKVLWAEAEENNLDLKVKQVRWDRWDRCSLCEQKYHGVVSCALGWACWKTYLGRPETDEVRQMAMGVLGSGLSTADYDEDALVVKEAELSMKRRLGAAEASILVAQSNLANTYQSLGRLEEAMCLRRDVYSGRVKLEGKEHERTVRAANNFASSLVDLDRFEEAKSVLLKMMPVARRVLGENSEITLRMRSNYAQSLYADPDATLDDLREAVTTLEDTVRLARRVLGGEHPTTVGIEGELQAPRAALHAREAGKSVVFVKNS